MANDVILEHEMCNNHVNDKNELTRDSCRIFEESYKHAQSYGLEFEFLDGFINYIRHGDPVKEAIGCALYDWDL